MSQGRASWQGVAGPGSGSHPSEIADGRRGARAPPLGTVSTVSKRFGAPVVRNLVRLLTVREVAEALALSRATVYAMVERGELGRVWVGAAIRVPAESLEAFVTRARRR